MQKKNTSYTVLLTGGHLTPAWALIDAIQSKHPEWKIAFVGRKYEFEHDTHVSQEYRIITQKNIPFYPITMGRFTRSLSFSTIVSFFKIPIGFIQALFLIQSIRPSIVVSFGGYIAVPLSWWAHTFGIPVITHEQTLSPGLANRFIFRIADRILTAFPLSHCGLRKTYSCVGLPVRKEIVNPPKTCSLPLVSGRPILLISGGTTGAQSMNERIFPCIQKLVKHYMVIHQTGEASLSCAKDVWKDLPDSEKVFYSFHSYIDAPDWGWILSHATVCIGRSGANTVYEIVLRNVPSIFIPLPWSSHQEQYKNAEFLVLHNSALLIPQRELTCDRLYKALTMIEKNQGSIRKHLQKLQESFPQNSTEIVVSILEEFFSASTV